jgi:hypothetical protein
MARLTGNVGLKDVGQTQATQGAQKGGFKGFMMSIGQGLARAGRAIAHFFGTSVPNFFKNLGQRNAVAVTTTDKPRSMLLGEEVKTSDHVHEMKMSTVSTTESTATKTRAKTSTSTIEEKSVDSSSTSGTDWKKANFVVKGSGNGGVVQAMVGKTMVAIKGGGGLTGNEVFGARLAQAVGLSAPTTRALTESEKTEVKQSMDKKGVDMPPRRHGDKAATMAIDWVDGELLGKEEFSASEGKALAQSLGKWIAFDAVIYEKDRFTAYSGIGSSGGINTANFIVNAKKAGDIVGIDQSVMPGDSSKFINAIRRGEDGIFLSIAMKLGDTFNMDPYEMSDIMKQSAQDMMKHIGTTLTNTKIDELSRDLSFATSPVNDLKERANLARS